MEYKKSSSVSSALFVHSDHRAVVRVIRRRYNYGEHSLEPLRHAFERDMVVSGFGDGGAHMRLQCEATTPTTMLSFWCRDRRCVRQLC